ncbi:MAG: helix-turn-helix domain-containing protein [Nitrospinales bacterium]
MVASRDYFPAETITSLAIKNKLSLDYLLTGQEKDNMLL